MLVNLENIASVKSSLSPICALDCETTGLSAFKGDRLFSVILSTATHDWYFNFNSYDTGETPFLPGFTLLKEILEDASIKWILQNAKFDMHMLANENLFIKGRVYDLMFLDRIHYNQHMSYNLASITKRWGEFKIETIDEYISEHGLTSKKDYPELGKTEVLKHYERVPLHIMQPYGEQDGRATYNTGIKVLTAISNLDSEIIEESVPKQIEVVMNESDLVKTLFEMEQLGVKVDVEYCKEALNFYFNSIRNIEKEFKDLTGLDFVKGTKVFEEVFSDEQDKWEKTDKGNYRWDASVLSKLSHPAARLALEYSEAKKQSEYFANFLYYSDGDGILHPNFMQNGTATGRFSSSNPNMQNMSSPDKYEEQEDGESYLVRRAIIPRDGYFFAMIDYNQSEFKMFLEYAKAHKLIEEVKGGKDIHQANADIAKVTRKQAKTIGFGLLYGQGVGKLTTSLYKTLGSSAQVAAIYKHMINFMITPEDRRIYATCSADILAHDQPLIRQAMGIKKAVLNASPELRDTLKSIQSVAETRGYIRNFYGRRCQFPDRKFAYRAPNHLIQGTCADMLKLAMNRIGVFLKDYKSRMLLCIHDEIVFEISHDEAHILPKLKQIMEDAYPYKFLPQTAEISYSKINLADKEAWRLS